jgi:hypothetical protein
MPHGWIAAGFVRAAVALFAYARGDGTLVLAAGVPLEWARAATGVSVARLRTPYGPLSYSIKPDGERSLVVEIAAGIEIPPNGIEVRSPASTREFVRIHTLPASIRFEY